jgi:hypothetical protein
MRYPRRHEHSKYIRFSQQHSTCTTCITYACTVFSMGLSKHSSMYCIQAFSVSCFKSIVLLAFNGALYGTGFASFGASGGQHLACPSHSSQNCLRVSRILHDSSSTHLHDQNALRSYDTTSTTGSRPPLLHDFGLCWQYPSHSTFVASISEYFFCL